MRIYKGANIVGHLHDRTADLITEDPDLQKLRDGMKSKGLTVGYPITSSDEEGYSMGTKTKPYGRGTINSIISNLRDAGYHVSLRDDDQEEGRNARV
jgi:hypothetical protein